MLNLLVKFQGIIAIIALAFFSGLILYIRAWEEIPILIGMWVFTIILGYDITQCIVDIEEDSTKLAFKKFNGKSIIVDKKRIRGKKDLCFHTIYRLDNGKRYHTNVFVSRVIEQLNKYNSDKGR